MRGSDQITTPEAPRARAARPGRARDEAGARILRLPHGSQPGQGLGAELPHDLLEDAVRRLGWLASAATIAGLAAFAFATLAPGVHLGVAASRPWLLGAIIAGSAAMAYAALRGYVPTWRVLDAAQLYQIALSAALAAIVNAQPWPVELLPSWSPVAVIVLLGPIIVPATTARTLTTALISAATDPLALLASVGLGLFEMPAPELVLMRFYPSALAVVIAVLVSRVVHRLGHRVARARDMGSYHLLERIGAGGMGEVWRATHRRLAREAAVKLIRPEALARASGAQAAMAAERFEREARAIAALRSPHTVQLYDSGVATDGTLFYVMELLDGVDLETLVRRDGPQPPERVVHILRQALHSLREAHARGLVHRDIKPANLMLCRYGEELDHLKVLDFGLVRDHARADALITGENVVAGTPAYFAPEIVTGAGAIDARTDLYALGCTAYYLLTGTLVFPEATPVQMAVAHATERPTRPSQRIAAPIPPALEAVVMACLEKVPERRPESALALDRALAAIELDRPWTDTRASAWWSAHRAA